MFFFLFGDFIGDEYIYIYTYYVWFVLIFIVFLFLINFYGCIGVLMLGNWRKHASMKLLDWDIGYIPIPISYI